MRLRNQLLALSVLTLLLPWAGWQLVQELENFLREGEEAALLASAKTIARTLPPEFQSELKLTRGQFLPLRQFVTAPVVDGFKTDWPERGKHLEFEAPDGLLKLKVLAGRHGSRFYLLLDVEDSGDTPATVFNTGTTDEAQRAGVVLYLQSNRSQHGYLIATEAPGELTVISQGDPGKRLLGAWMNTARGYTVEISLPPDVERISVGAVTPTLNQHGASTERSAGTLNGRREGDWLELAGGRDAIPTWLSSVVPKKTRAWLLQSDGWVVADSGISSDAGKSELTWIQRLIYQGVANSDMPLREPPPEWPVRVESSAVEAALAGNDGRQWSRDRDSAVVYNLVAVPVYSEQEVLGAVVMEARSEGLLLMTNRALGRLLFITLLVVAVLAFALWLFASRLSHRVQKLSGAVSQAMDDASQVPKLPQTASADELGDLARNTETLLKAVADYTVYLQKLAGRLSHELKTPIAITRSSLENLASLDLDPQAQQYMERARDGLDRQAAIVSAMSEAQRLEGSVRSADWEKIDLGEMLGHCVDGYRSVHPSRTIKLNIENEGCELHCAPELIAQALDKLVDNAVTLSAEDCVIEISLRRDEGDCLLAVANTGSHLPDVLQEQLFDSLVSLRDKGSTGRHLGLGLHIVRLVAEAHGGKAQARNLPDNAGVEFTIRLPDTTHTT